MLSIPELLENLQTSMTFCKIKTVFEQSDKKKQFMDQAANVYFNERDQSNFGGRGHKWVTADSWHEGRGPLWRRAFSKDSQDWGTDTQSEDESE